MFPVIYSQTITVMFIWYEIEVGGTVSAYLVRLLFGCMVDQSRGRCRGEGINVVGVNAWRLITWIDKAAASDVTSLLSG